MSTQRDQSVSRLRRTLDGRRVEGFAYGFITASVFFLLTDTPHRLNVITLLSTSVVLAQLPYSLWQTWTIRRNEKEFKHSCDEFRQVLQKLVAQPSNNNKMP